MLAALARTQAHALRLDGRGLDCVESGKGRLLDVGCGNGSFLGVARQAGWECYGVEPDPEAVTVATAQGITVLASSVDELRGMRDENFEFITLNHVIEHVHDPTQTLRDCLAMLKPRGFIWLETPNIESIGYQIYGRCWRGLEPPRHLVLFNRKSLTQCLANAGFIDVKFLPPRDAVGYTFLQSELISAGALPEVDHQGLSVERAKTLKANMKAARRAVRGNANRSEFLTVMAYKS